MKSTSFLVVVCCLLTNHVLLAGEMRRADCVLLNGDWECPWRSQFGRERAL